MNQLQRDLMHRIAELHGEWIERSLQLYSMADRPRHEALACIVQELIDALASATLAYDIPESDLVHLLRGAQARFKRKWVHK